MGNIKGPQGNSITIVEAKIQYQLNASGTTPDEYNWEDSPPEIKQGLYYWTKTYVLYSDDTSTITYSVAYIGSDGVTVSYELRVTPDAITFDEEGRQTSGQKLKVEKIKVTSIESYPTDYGYVTVQKNDGEEQDYGVAGLDTSGVYDESKSYARQYTPFLIKTGTDDQGNILVLGKNNIAILGFERSKE